ncbi:chemotaxis protein [Erythrobacter sp. SAORIC-644]|nr:chemotaxis protein [Erythrobacter sp. SAORIC-644]
MKLLIRQYVASLRESGELDAILPDLLSELGYNVISRPMIGTRQYGVDIAAVGKDEDGERKLFLFSVKQGDLTRTDWEGTPQALRPSLDEIRTIYLRLRVPKEYQNLKTVICICFGGEVRQNVQDNVTGYIEEHTSDRLTFQQWNGDLISGLLIDGILKDSLVEPALRTSFQKAVAMVDEPAVCFEHFSELVHQLCAKEADFAKDRATIARQLYLCLWVLFVWARDAENVEGPYQASELVVLHCWKLLQPSLGKSSKASREVGEVFNEIVELHFAIFDQLVSEKILPHVDKLHAISTAVGSSSPVDVNLKLFDLAGRIALHGLWKLWLASGDECLPAVRDDWNDEQVQDLAQKLVLLARNNPALLSPMQDAQSIDIALGLMFLTMQKDWQPAAINWVEALTQQIIFAFRTHARYPTIQQSYRELLYHPRERTDEYRQEQTAGSTLIPLLSLWATRLGNAKTAQDLADFTEKYLAHCNCQLWLPDEDSEEHVYLRADEHGAMLNGVPITPDGDAAMEMIQEECSVSPHFPALSAIEMGHWPILLLACRHHRLPVPPQLWIGLLS